MKALIAIFFLVLPVILFAADKKVSPFGGGQNAAPAEMSSEKTVQKTGEKTAPAPQTSDTKSNPESAKATVKTTVKTKTKPKAEPTVSSDESVGDTIECKSGEDVRKLVTVAKDNGCEVEYTKFGSTKVIGGAQYNNTVCTTVVSQVRESLEGAGFTCN